MLTFRQKIEISFLSEMKKQQEIKNSRPTRPSLAGKPGKRSLLGYVINVFQQRIQPYLVFIYNPPKYF